MPADAAGTGGETYRRLMAGGRGDPIDRHVFACALVIGRLERPRPLTDALGLAPDQLAAMADAFFPRHAALMTAAPTAAGTAADAPEEPDLRQLLLRHRACGQQAEEWLAHIIARRSLSPNHLWQDLGLFARDELNRLLARHFPQLARRNSHDMKWKKFFYRELCQQDGVLVCRAPVCDDCDDAGLCFGDEAGEPLSGLPRPLLGTRHIPPRV
jgi:nitrogen fixation protein NifQ